MTRKNQKKPTQSAPAVSPGGGPSQAQRWLLRLLLAVGVPLLLLLSLEGLLRLAGYGYDPNFFKAVGHDDLYGSNYDFGRGYFPEAIARRPVENSFPKTKPDDTYRIMLLGSSAAIGVPDAAYSFGRVLEVMLEQNYAGVDFEVVIAGITATNSHVVLPIARECVKFDPDLLLVYLGNNEVIGPYGLGAEDGAVSPSLSTIRTGIKLRRTKIGQLLQGIVDQTSGRADVHENWGGMAMYSDNHVPLGDPRLDRIYENYQRNLSDICEAGTQAGADVVLCTVPSNLAESPPFGSLESEALDVTQKNRWSRLFDAGRNLARQGDYAGALAEFRQAGALDDQHAELRFYMGVCHSALGQTDEALTEYLAAKDLDTLRFRTDSRLNDLVRQVAKTQRLSAQGSGRVRLADCERFLLDGVRQPNEIPGTQLFFEHVHMTFQGSYAIAAAAYPQVVRGLPATVSQRGSAQASPPAMADCAAALAFTEWDDLRLHQRMVEMISRPPFTAQAFHKQSVDYLNRRMAQIHGQSTEASRRQVVETYQRALQKRPNDVLLAINYISLLSQSGRSAEAESRLRRLLTRLSPNSSLVSGSIQAGTN